MKNKRTLEKVPYTLNSPYPIVDMVINIFQKQFLKLSKLPLSIQALSKSTLEPKSESLKSL